MKIMLIISLSGTRPSCARKHACPVQAARPLRWRGAADAEGRPTWYWEASVWDVVAEVAEKPCRS